ncbi:DUF6415 family natural product biosynthesis protein [Streptomyces dysideae]|uniref:Uncharacterized protein n=1 Tax=Streptomyces dysideae TaxID=909626 RepID=A0A117S001_9ACTN|nr:DUF6415 family natural product biosynthesis protein [Streptomyces dysideae]KUO19056.1 hypothetical protein AQJ91_21870 [Streptomyces dysideae]
MPENTLLPLDADTIRMAYDSVLWAPRLPTGEELDTLKEQLQGHVQLLVPDVQDLAARMRGEMRRLTVHVLVRAFQLLEEYADGPPACDVYDLATIARALLTLYRHPGPLGVPTGADEIAEEIRRRLCGACWEPIADDELHERRTFGSDSSGGIHGYAHTELCVDRSPLLALCHHSACAGGRARTEISCGTSLDPGHESPPTAAGGTS